MPIGLAYMLAFMGWVLLVVLRVKTPQTVAVHSLTRAAPLETDAASQPVPPRVLRFMGLELLLTLCAAGLLIVAAYTFYLGDQSSGLRYLVGGLTFQAASYAIEFARGLTVSAALTAERTRPDSSPEERVHRMTPRNPLDEPDLDEA
jgi:hypothetical protein